MQHLYNDLKPVEILIQWQNGEVTYENCIDKLTSDILQQDSRLKNSIDHLHRARIENYITKQEYCLTLYDLLSSSN